MIAQLYRTLTDLGGPVISYYLRRRLKEGREDAARFAERLGEASLPRPRGFLVWCHAASVGEAMSLLALIDRLRQRRPDASVLVTTGTVASARMLEGRLPAGVMHQYVPVDRAPYVRKFLDHWMPDLVIWVESELWPNLLDGVRKQEIPAVLLNARMSDKSFRQWYRVRGWAKEILSTFNICLTQTEAERGRFVTLGARPVKRIENLKYAANPLPFDAAALDELRAAVAGRDVWLIASTHRGEEEVAIAAHKQLKPAWPNLLTIIVPRHAARGDEVAGLLEKQGVTFARRSKAEAISAIKEIYLADTMGELGLFYRLAPIVAVGGSFAPVGGHNPIEPAQLGTALIFGPAMFNFSEIAREFLFDNAAIQLKHDNELGYTVNRLLSAPGERERFAVAAQLLAGEKRKSLDTVLRELEPWLTQTPQRKARRA